MTERRRYFVVDRIEGALAVLVADDRSTTEVPVSALPKGVREDDVLRVPVRAARPDWSRAVVDAVERRRRVDQSSRALEEMKKRDPGGDVDL
jgi:hypothetical protein